MPPHDGAAEVRHIVVEAEDVMPDCGLDLLCTADIAPRSVQWLWPGRIARGKVTMLAGHPGLGKSQLALAIAAIVTTGGRWPVDGFRAECGSAVILSAEDDAEDTIRPRLEAAGADLARRNNISLYLPFPTCASRLRVRRFCACRGRSPSLQRRGPLML